MQLSWSNLDWKSAALSALATCVSYWLALRLGLKTGYWAAITCVMVTQSEVGATLVASRDRLIGTAIWALAGWGRVLIWHEHLWMFGVADRGKPVPRGVFGRDRGAVDECFVLSQSGDSRRLEAKNGRVTRNSVDRK